MKPLVIYSYILQHKIFWLAAKFVLYYKKIGSRVMLSSINSNVLALKIIRKLEITEKPLNQYETSSYL
jgi:hypothetical protein